VAELVDEPIHTLMRGDLALGADCLFDERVVVALVESAFGVLRLERLGLTHRPARSVDVEVPCALEAARLGDVGEVLRIATLGLEVLDDRPV
jgi:hypothetical protein